MKKIYTSILAIVLAVGLVSGAAYALFSDTVTVSGLSVTTGNADLMVNYDTSSTDGLGFSMQNIYPGWVAGKRFSLKNESLSDIGLDLSMILSAYTNPNQYLLLKNEVSIAILEYESWQKANQDLTDGVPGVNTTTAITHNTTWKTLEEWGASSQDISSSPLAKGTDRYYVIWATVDENADNGISEKSSAISFVITGEQHL